ncbi:MAG: peptide-methionine (S)-S-oxide reductase MsrA [Proteobacteria bacterium]|nr:peptide-methionine (S)-S-oxide reductase MsrA [Pseudomonadota bacterium]
MSCRTSPVANRVVAWAFAAAWVLSAGCASAAAPPVAAPPPVVDAAKAPGASQTAVLAGGCFWGVQGVFEHLSGVRRVVAGYSGGERSTAHYEIVGAGGTGHAESVEITYDPAQVTYGEILQVFFSVAHDPTQANGQGPDMGAQYRSVIFYSSDEQRRIALAYIAQLNRAGTFHAPIVTHVDAYRGFYPAEGYHQDFLLHNPGNSYIVYNDLPKIQSFQKLLPALYQGKPVTLAAAAAP